MRRIFIIGFLLAACGLAVSAQDKKDKLVWKTATILEKRFDSNVVERRLNESYPDDTRTFSARDDSEWIMLKADETTYFLSRKLTVFWEKKLKIEKNSPVEYAIADDFIYLRNTKGKKLKYKIDNKFPN